MFNLILFGPPGSGKGTQSASIVSKYGLRHLSTGDLLRSEISAKSELGLKAKTFMDQGQLVPDEVVIGMISSEMEKNPDAQGFLFDGFPRTAAQAEALDKLLSEKNASINVMLALDVDEDELIKRLLNRGKTSGRSDDTNENVIKARITEYHNKTAAVADYYKQFNKVVHVKGVGSVEDIFDALSAEIDKRTGMIPFEQQENFIFNDSIKLLSEASPETPANWGKMNLTQTIEHLTDFFNVSAQKVHYDLVTPIEQLPAYKAFIMSDKMFRENTRAPQSIIGETPLPVKSASYAQAVDALKKSVENFKSFFAADANVQSTHPVFGPLNYAEWIRLHYKHVWHHLRQFGCIAN